VRPKISVSATGIWEIDSDEGLSILQDDTPFQAFSGRIAILSFGQNSQSCLLPWIQAIRGFRYVPFLLQAELLRMNSINCLTFLIPNVSEHRVSIEFSTIVIPSKLRHFDLSGSQNVCSMTGRLASGKMVMRTDYSVSLVWWTS
jgi:hypothetical protein